MEIINLKVYGLEESIIRSGYPMQVGKPDNLETLQYKRDSSEYLKSYTRSEKLANTPTGSGHNNFLKGIIVQFDLRYPEYFSPQLQRYHWIDIVSSQSKMHKLMSRQLVKDDFTEYVLQETIDQLNIWIDNYINSKFCNKDQMFKSVITNLPSGYLKWMGISTNYLQLKTIYKQRKNHKLQEWKDFCAWIETLPMSQLITK